MVALGKFDAMHRGHAQLASRASRIGTPYLMSFSGMAEVLGWESKLPVVAACDRPRVCEAWAPECDDQIVREHRIPFAAIRRMSPEEFVLTLRDDIGVGGVVAGRNYRFGFKAAGTAETLVELGEKHGIDVDIVDLLQADEAEEDCVEEERREEAEAKEGEKSGPRAPAPGECTPQVSSTRVRACLAAGDVEQAERLLGRRHRLVLRRNGDGDGDGDGEEQEQEQEQEKKMMRQVEVGGLIFPVSAALNQYPAPGKYGGEVATTTTTTGAEAGAGAAVGGVAVTVVVGESDIRIEPETGSEEALDRVVAGDSNVCVDFIARAP